MEHPPALDPELRRRRLIALLETLAAAHVLFPTAIVTVAIGVFVLGLSMNGWVLPLAAATVVVGLRAFSASWREAGLIAALVAGLHIGAGLLSAQLPDRSWDGVVYHQEAVLRLAAGWNPLFEDAAGYGPQGQEIYINHYPKATWIAGAAVLLNTGHIEAGKLFNLTLMLAAGALSLATLLRVTAIPVPVAVGLAALTAFNPIVISQSTTFYVDGAIGSLLTVLVAALIGYVAAPRWQTLCVALLAASLVINVKFTALVYAPVLLALGVLVMWWWHGRRAAYRVAVGAAVSGVFGALILGYAPYVRNWTERGSVIYPIIGAPQYVDLGLLRPVNLQHENRVMRFLISNLSRSESVRAPSSTRLKFPLSIGPEERRGVYGADLEVGGFGPLYGALLLLTGVLGCTLFARRTARATGALVLLVVSCLLLSIFVHSETWYARYVPQAWLLPFIIVVPALHPRRHVLDRWLGYSIVALATANVMVVAANVAWRQLVYTRATSSTLLEMSTARQPVSVYLGAFRPLRQRLHEAGVDFRIVDAPPASQTVRHPIPTPGNRAFWFE